MRQTHKTERTDFGSKSSVRTWFTTGGPQVDDLDFIGVLESRRVSLRQTPKQTSTLTNFGAIAARDLGYDQHPMGDEREGGVAWG